jgi:alcohol dehydrogenase
VKIFTKSQNMRAIAVNPSQSADLDRCFTWVELDLPTPQGHDLLVRVHAIALNPVDYKVRLSIKEPQPEPRILGWDACGVVTAIGDQVSLFQVGDLVYYAGSVTRPGCNSEYQLVDERIVGHKPITLSDEAAAALPLTTITAWESLFERLGLTPEPTAQNGERSILIINGAGGVGSIAIQLAKHVAGLRVIATAARPESIAWCEQMGADACINHHQPLTAQLEPLGMTGVDYILCLHNTDLHFPEMAKAIKPRGKICAIVENKAPLDIHLLKDKSASFSWEFMFTKAKYQTPDLQSQHDLLDHVADLVDRGILRSTMTQNLGSLNPASLAQAHSIIQLGHAIGKIVLSNS